jgi:hypothetical protein
MKTQIILGGVSLLISISALADSGMVQDKLMDIATQEAQIANIGANKAHMLYGLNNPILIINRWNELEKHPALSNEQIAAINELEEQKKQILRGVGKWCAKLSVN